MTYIGNTAPSRFSSVPAVQRFSGNNSTTAFTLSTAIGSEQEILVSVDGVIQDTANYTVSGTTLTFSPAPSAGTNNIFVFTLSRAIASVTHPSTSALSATSGTFSGNVSVGGDLDVTGSLDMSDANLTNVGSIQLDSIAGDADTNTTISFPGSDIITLGTAGSERVRINASGNVGIGIASPDGKVHIHTATAGSVTANAAADELVLENSGDAGLTILSPNANNSQILLGSPVAIAGGIIRWTGDDNAVKIGTNNSGGTLRFHVGGFSEVMRISSAGNVGIGTSSIDTTTQISKSTTSTDGSVYPTLKVENTSAGSGNSYARFQVNGGNGTSAFTLLADGRSSNSDISLRTTTNTPMSFYTNNSERMRITSAGKVGIGDTSPLGNKVHIRTGGSASSVNATAGLVLEDDDSTRCDLQFIGPDGTFQSILFGDVSDDDIGKIAYSHTGNNMRFTVNASERMRIDNEGNLLVNGTSDTGFQIVSTAAGTNGCLDCISSSTNGYYALRIDMHANNNYAQLFRQGGSVVGWILTQSGGTSYNTSSDYRLKENVTYDFDATTRLKQLRPARFNFIAHADNTVDGFIAHEVSSIVPEAISGTHNEVDDDGNAVMQGIDQSKLVPLLVKSLQEAMTRIETLEAKVTALEGE